MNNASARYLVRAVLEDEFEAVGRLTLDTYETSGILGTDPGYRAALLDVAARTVAPGQVLVAVDAAGQLLGAVAYCPWGSRFAEVSREGEAEFRMLAVAPQARGRGVARALVEACRLAAVREGCATLTLCVIDHNTDAAHMYQHLGFARSPERDWEPVPGVLLRVWTLPLTTEPADASDTAGSEAALWCERCGKPRSENGHERCDQALALEPPRYCRFCRRRMTVQVLPTGWHARCKYHGITVDTR